jgi:hypothetical protein
VHTTKAAVLLCLLGAYPLAAATLPTGREVVVKSGDRHAQRTPAAAISANGQAVVVWADANLGIRGRTVGGPGGLGAEFALVANLNHPPVPGSARVTDRKDPVVIFDSAGATFFVFWTNELADLRVDYFYEDRQVVEQRVFGQRFDLSGQPIGAEFQVSTAVGGFQSRPQVARLECGTTAPDGCADGALVIGWQSDDLAVGSGPGEGVFARSVDAQGVFSGQVRLSPPSVARNVSLAADEQGNFLAVWDAPNAATRGVFARPFNFRLRALNKATLVNQRIVTAQDRPVAAYSTATSQYLTLWQGKTGTDRYRTFGRLISQAGLPVANQFPVTVGKSEWEVYPTLAPTLDGGYTVVWLAYDRHFPSAVRGVELGSDGSRIGGEFDVSEHRPGAQARISLAAGLSGQMLSTYEGYDDRHASSINLRALERTH